MDRLVAERCGGGKYPAKTNLITRLAISIPKSISDKIILPRRAEILLKKRKQEQKTIHVKQ